MNQSSSDAGDGDGYGCRGVRIPMEDEVEVIDTLLHLPELFAKSQLLSQYAFTWGRKKKRSVLVSKSQSSPTSHRQINEKELTAVEADKSPSTPLCFLPSASGSDCGLDKHKRLSSSKKHSKRKATNDLIERYNRMQQEREALVKKVKAMETIQEELRAQNLDLKRRKLEINPRKTEEFQLWNNGAKFKREQVDYHRQVTVSAPPPQPQPQPLQCQQFMVDRNNCKVVAVNCSGNSNGGGRFGFFNQIDPRVKIHGVTYDFMGASQPLDHSNYLLLDNDLRARTAADARKYRVLKMKENRNSSLAMKLSRACR